uniref:Uncharacterized protein n=1 Tax=Chenopodium quinoa TaxID=63459 RepID=A0A803MT21_CHEQI
MAGKLTKRELSTFAALAWASWTSKNKSIHEQESHNPRMLAAGFVRYVHDYNLYSGAVVQDSGGTLLVTAARRRIGGWDPSIAEAAAMCFGIEIAHRLATRLFGLRVMLLE